MPIDVFCGGKYRHSQLVVALLNYTEDHDLWYGKCCCGGGDGVDNADETYAITTLAACWRKLYLLTPTIIVVI